MITAVPDVPGRHILIVSWVGTALLAVTAGPATVIPEMVPIAFAVAMAEFLAGCGVFVLAYIAGINRSRTHALGIGGWFFLMGKVAPRSVSRHLVGSLLAQVAISIATAAARPFSTLAFGTLAPLLALSCCGWWGGRHGTFAPKAGAIPTERARTAPVDQNAPHG